MAKRKKKKAAAAAGSKPPTKSEVFAKIAEDTELTRRQISEVFESLATVIKKNLSSRGPGAFTMPGLCKMIVKKRPATKARKGINPFTGEQATFKAKPASKTVRIRPLKNLKEMVK
jgi:nucleoid DNA-binding protein